MKVSYFPGCALKTTARNMDETAKAVLATLNVELIEPERWTCCGVVHSLADDDVMRLLGPVQNLIRIKATGSRKVVTACSMCYNSLARANHLMGQDNKKKQTVNLYLEEEEDYNGDVEVVHLLSFLRDEVGWDAIRQKVKAPLQGISLAPYYGCALSRPLEVAIECENRPTILTDLLRSLGATVVDFSAFDRCCSSYQTVTNPDMAAIVAAEIKNSAKKSGASAIVTSCPLCYYNLVRIESQTSNEEGSISTYYFTELMADAFGLRMNQ